MEFKQESPYWKRFLALAALLVPLGGVAGLGAAFWMGSHPHADWRRIPATGFHLTHLREGISTWVQAETTQGVLLGCGADGCTPVAEVAQPEITESTPKYDLQDGPEDAQEHVSFSREVHRPCRLETHLVLTRGGELWVAQHQDACEVGVLAVLFIDALLALLGAGAGLVLTPVVLAIRTLGHWLPDNFSPH